MVLFFRILLLVLTSPLRSRVGFLEQSSIRLSVLPTDADLYTHLNNGRYLSMMDLGRLDLALRSGLARVIRKNRWFPVVGAAMIRYRRPIHIFDRLRLETSVVGWDEKWIWILHRFLIDETVRAEAVVKAVFRHGGETVSPARIFEALDCTVPPVRVPEWIEHWSDSTAAMKTREDNGEV